MRSGRRRGGFSLLELAVVVCIVAVLFNLALDRLLRYAEIAEKSAMEQSVAAMRSALALRFASLYLRGTGEALQRLPDENPMDWLAEKPPGYLGELATPSLEQLERPSWYYDRRTRELVYVPLRTRFLDSGPLGDVRIRYRVVVRFQPAAEAGGLPSLDRLGIDPSAPIRWFPAES